LPFHNGREPVREWLKGLEPEDRNVIGEEIEDVEIFVTGRHRWFVRWAAGCGKSEATCQADGPRESCYV